MGKQTNIQWTNDTWNPWHGCIKISPGCKNCYMYSDKKRYGQDPHKIVRAKPATFNAPLTKLKGPLVFTCSWSDFFIEEADQWRPEAWEIIKATPHLTYQILTKRPERIKKCLPPDWGDGYKNVWLGISAEDKKHYQYRMTYLFHVKAHIKFISFEPLLGDVGDLMLDGIFENVFQWAIIGGESGHGARLFNTDWADNIIRQCKDAGIAVFMKQLGSFVIQGGEHRKKKDKKGGDMSEWPHELRIREFPKAA